LRRTNKHKRLPTVGDLNAWGEPCPHTPEERAEENAKARDPGAENCGLCMSRTSAPVEPSDIRAKVIETWDLPDRQAAALTGIPRRAIQRERQKLDDEQKAIRVALTR